MIRDKGPSYLIGYGTTKPIHTTEEGVDPESGVFAKALGGHPIAAFLATSAASLVGMHVAGKLIREGGLSLAKKAEAGGVKALVEKISRGAATGDMAQAHVTSAINDMRRLRQTFEQFENDSLFRGIPESRRNYTEAREALAEARRMGTDPDMVWTMKDQVTQKMLRQAKTLPYALPAMYLTQRGLIDPMMGEKSDVDWYNPVDVIGDFAESSIKNILFTIAPFEVGGSALGYGTQKFMSAGLPYQMGGAVGNAHYASRMAQQALNRAGNAVGSAIGTGAEVGLRTAYAFNAGVEEALKSRLALDADTAGRVIGKTTSVYGKGRVAGGNRLMSFLKSSEITQVGGMRGFFEGFGKEWKGLKDNPGQAAMRARNVGRTPLDTILADLAEMRGPFGETTTNLGMSFSQGSFFTHAARMEYQRTLARQLGLRLNLSFGTEAGSAAAKELDGVAGRAAELFSVHELPTHSSVGKVQKRLRLGDAHVVENQAELIDMLKEPLAKLHGPKMTDEALQRAHEQAQRIAKELASSVKATDEWYLRNSNSIRETVRNAWHNPVTRDGVLNEHVLPYIEGRLGVGKIDQKVFSRPMDNATADYVARRAASAAGIGGAERLSATEINDLLRAKGINPRSAAQVRSLLIRGGELDQPWRRGGFNIFGFRKVFVDEMLEGGRFSGLAEGMSSQQRSGLRALNESIADGNISENLGQLRRLHAGKVYVNRQGKVVDLSAFEGLRRRVFDKIADTVEVPITHINPLRVGFYNVFRALGGQRSMEVGSVGTERLIGDQGGDLLNTVWFNRGKRSYAARTALVRTGDTRATETRVIENVKRAPTDPESMVGRTVRMAAGDRGIIYGEEKPRGLFKEFFDIGRSGEDSVFSYLGRVGEQIGYKDAVAGRSLGVGKKVRTFVDKLIRPSGASNVSNPAELARRMLEPGFLDDLIANPASPEAIRVARLFETNLSHEVKRLGALDPRHIDILATTEEFKDVLKVGVGKGEKVWRKGSRGHVFEAVTGEISLADVGPYDETVRRMAEHVLSMSPEEALRQAKGTVSDSLVDEFKQLQGNLRKYMTGDLTSPAPESLRKVGVSRKVDELRQELVRYSIAKEDIIHRIQNPTAKAGEKVSELFTTIDKLVSEGKATAKEAGRMRTAALSIQIEQMQAAEFAKRAGTSATERTLQIAKDVADSSAEGRRLLESLGTYENRVPGEGKLDEVRRGFLRRFSVGKGDPQQTYNPFGGDNSFTLVPTFGSAFRKNPLGAVGSVLGFNTWSSPGSFNTGSFFSSHMFERLNRYFQTFGLGLNPDLYKGPLDFYARGMVGKRVLPIVATGATALAVDSTIGGMVNKDDQGDPIYSPFFLGKAAKGVALGQVAMAGVVPGGQTAEEKREELFEGEVAVRKGRWWPLGNTPFKGGKISYYRPSWYRRFTSGSQYTGQLWDSPMEKLAFGYDFSPGKYIDPYRFERKHYADRPYPVTGEMFTGPWGPLTGALNSTIGRILKPPIRMHRAEVAAALDQYGPVGEFAATTPRVIAGGPPVYVNDRGRMQVGVPTTTGSILDYNGSGENGAVMSAGVGTAAGAGIAAAGGANASGIGMGARVGGAVGQTATPGSGFVMDAVTAPFVAGRPVRQNLSNSWNRPEYVDANTWSASSSLTRREIGAINQTYVDARDDALPISRRTAINSPYYQGMRPSMMNEVIPNVTPITSTSIGVQAGQLGYELQEMAGIYGFAFGSAREALGFGGQDFSPKRPVLTSASRAYGMERKFWDLQMGGLGDAPIPFAEGEYANIELSEIVRRFIPHRRRDITEVNPIKNQMGMEYPWLPGGNYFTNFKEGDPYAQIADGEIRLPGKAYERFNRVHPDATGRYGLVDQYKILGDVAQYSDEFRAINRVISKMDLTTEEQEIVSRTRAQVAAKNKTREFSPYLYNKQNFDTETFTISGKIQGKGDQFITEELGPSRPLRLAGVRARSQDAQDFLDKLLKPGTKVEAKFDANATGQTLDAIVTANGQNVNEQLMESGFGTNTELRNPIDVLTTSNKYGMKLGRLKEYIGHLDTPFNTKFMPMRTATEDWERNYVYSSTFQQWQHPIRDYLKPMAYKASERNPIAGAVAGGFVGRLFSSTPAGKAIGTTVGATAGATASFTGMANRLLGNDRFVPEYRVKELAIEEQTDILNYVKNLRLYGQARAEAIRAGEPDPEIIYRRARDEGRKDQAIGLGEYGTAALQYRKALGQTMYGADPFGDVTDLNMAIPKRKREHFQEMINAPKSERKRILSTAGRLERRILEARWGMDVEKRPDLTEYFSNHELPPPEWEGWDPGVDMEMVKLKTMQHEGLDLSQLGYYPQQVQQANLVNVSYPDFTAKSSKRMSAAQLSNLLSQQGVAANVYQRPSVSGSNHINLTLGVER